MAENATIVSSDGHAVARMAEYRPYLDAEYRDDFDDFLEKYRDSICSGVSDLKSVGKRLDPDVLEDWQRRVIEPNRLEGLVDPQERIGFMDAEGIAADVLFPDFGTAFEIPPMVALPIGYVRSPRHAWAANRAHTRWVADFIQIDPDRFAALALINFDDVDEACREIRWAHEHNMKGIVLPQFDDDVPLYDVRHDPIWALLSDLGMVVNSHTSMSSVTRRTIPTPPTPHQTSTYALVVIEMFFFTRQILPHLIWGGVLERFPNLKVVLTEQGSGWVRAALEMMDYTYDGSYARQDVREIIRRKPSEYFERQVWLGSSLYSEAEIKLRDTIGIHKMMLGTDYPHHEGTWGAGPGTKFYLQATLGAAQVPTNEAKMMMSETAIKVFNLDAEKVTAIGRRIGPSLEQILTPPTEDLFPRGDVHKPFAGTVGS
jgi:predicted TIM-barrel fold metal-dependent hydrolase